MFLVGFRVVKDSEKPFSEIRKYVGLEMRRKLIQFVLQYGGDPDWIFIGLGFGVVDYVDME